jgi:hypothetical protein
MALVCVFAAAIGACGGGSSKHATANQANQNVSATSPATSKSGSGNKAGSDAACKLVSQDDATKLFTVPAQPGTKTMDIPHMTSQCHWKAEDADNHNWRVDISVFDTAAAYGESQFPGAEHVVGLGDKAFVQKSDSLAGVTIQFVHADQTFQVNYAIANVLATTPKHATDQTDQLIAMLKANVSQL